MIVFQSPASPLHDPATFFRRGAMIDHPESAGRYGVLVEAVAAAGHEVRAPADAGAGPIAEVHDADYLEFLRTAWSRRAEVEGAGVELIPSHFARGPQLRRPEGLTGQLGWYATDTSTPILASTWEAIYGSAQAAIAAADQALAGGAAYALCRPPGHHATQGLAGGFCYLNTTAIAAQRLASRTGARVAVLDIDAHHGNGTQAIFWRRGDVLTVSVHGDPSNFFPFYCGYADERGAGAGEGANLNLPLARRSDDEAFLAAVDRGLAAIAEFCAEALVVALGLDGAEDDPLGALAVTTGGFARAAERIGGFAGPTALVQEGGYLCEALPRNLAAFLEAFEGARR